MVGVDGSSPFAPTKFGRDIKHLAETLGAFFLAVPKKYQKPISRCGPGRCRVACMSKFGATADGLTTSPRHMVSNGAPHCHAKQPVLPSWIDAYAAHFERVRQDTSEGSDIELALFI